MTGVIRILMDGSEWCDSRCKGCDLYKNRMITKDERVNKSYYHGFREGDAACSK